MNQTADYQLPAPSVISRALSWLGGRGPRDAASPMGQPAITLLVDADRHQVRVRGQRIHVSPQEFRLLGELWNQQDRVLRHDDLERALYGEAGVSARQAIRQTVKRLRERLGDASDLIETVPGIGYMLRVPYQVTDLPRAASL